MTFVMAVVEGALEVHIAQRLSDYHGFQFGAVHDKGGGSGFWRAAGRFNHAASRLGPVLGLVDLERARCPSELILAKLGQEPHPNFALRIAVRMSESWLLADAHGIAQYLHVPLNRVSADPEAEGDPKQRVVNLASGSRSREIRESLVPSPDMRGAKVGREYLRVMSVFVRDRWNIDAAARRANSLRRALDAIAARL